MYRRIKNKPTKTNLVRNTSYIGETLEQKIHRIIYNKEPISDGAPLLYTDRKSGVPYETDIRSDKWEMAVDAAEKGQTIRKAQRDFYSGEKTYDTMTPEQQKEHTKKFPDSKFNKKSEA